MPVGPVVTYQLTGLQPAMNVEDAIPIAVVPAPSLTNVQAGAILGQTTVVANAVHRIAADSATFGTFKILFRGFLTTVLNFNSSGAAVAAAMNLLPSVGAGQIVGAGANINTAGGAGITLTYSGTLFASQPVELPTIVVVTAADVAITATSVTAGSNAGEYVLYNDAGANGAQIAKVINKYNFSTDGSGKVTFADVAVGEEFKQTALTIPVYISGTFRSEDLQQAGVGAIDAAGLVDLNGHIVSGTIAVGLIHIG